MPSSPNETPRDPAADQRPVLLARLLAHGRAKLWLVPGLMLWLGLPYYLLQRVELFPPERLARLPLDQAVPFDPDWVWVYVSYYLLIPLPPLLMRRLEPLVRYVVGMGLVGLAGFIVFLLFPTVLPRPPAPGANAGWDLLVAIDRPRNVFPSLHGALSVHAALAAEALLGRLSRWQARGCRLVLWVWVGAILYAAVATGQHVVLDIVGGACLGVIVWVAIWRLWRPEGAARLGRRIEAQAPSSSGPSSPGPSPPSPSGR